MVASRCRALAACIALGIGLLGRSLHAEERSNRDEPREQAAELYDRGVAQFERQDYAGAARSFLDADVAAPSDDAVRNALAAARRANDDVLVRAAAERALAREDSDPELARQARAALAALPPLRSGPPPASVPPAPTTTGATTTSGPSTASVATRTSAASDTAPSPSEPAWARPVFFAGAVATGALVGLTIWSGVDALHARNELPGTQADNDDVTARAHRTDAFLASSVIVGAATAYVGLAWVSWRKHPAAPRASASVDGRGAYVSVSGDF